MDEFDVFMDAVNRHVSIDMLLQTGERHRHRQFIFITPHNPSAISVGPYVRIHKMSPPERGQQRIDTIFCVTSHLVYGFPFSEVNIATVQLPNREKSMSFSVGTSGEEVKLDNTLYER